LHRQTFIAQRAFCAMNPGRAEADGDQTPVSLRTMNVKRLSHEEKPRQADRGAEGMPDANVKIHVAQDRKTVTIETSPAAQPSCLISLTLDELDKLIGELGDARSRMVEGLPRETFNDDNMKISAVANTTWCVKASPPNGALLAFDHPKFGPVGFTLRRDQIASIVRFLTNRFILQPPPSEEKH
jgi:hypothetical protein